MVLIFGPFWVIFWPFLEILGHFWAIMGNFGSFLFFFGSFFGHFSVLIFFGQKCNSVIFITFCISAAVHIVG